MAALPETILKAFGADFFRTDPTDLEAYGRDWTRAIAPAPLAVALPRTTAEISKLLTLASKEKIAIVPSGGRTGLSGGAVAAKGELVLSLERMRGIGKVDPLSRTVRVEAGAVTEAVHRHCEPHGLTWPVDFASKGSSTVGGNLATNAGGINVIRYGCTRDWVLSIEAVLMDGSILELNRGALIKNNTGYDLRHLLIGSEGTLAVITGATLRLAPVEGETKVLFLALSGLDAVLRLFRESQEKRYPLLSFETLSRACLESVMAHRGLPDPFAAKSGYYVVMEVERTDGDIDSWLESLFERDLVIDGTLAFSSRDRDALWQYREGISESLSAKSLVHKNDISLPIARIEEFEKRFLALFSKRYPDFEVFVFGHIGDGNLHVNIQKPQSMAKDEFLAKCKAVDPEVFSLLRDLEGSVSAEHGIGLLKRDALPYSRSEREIELFRGIKKAFDPEGLLNPGKIFEFRLT